MKGRSICSWKPRELLAGGKKQERTEKVALEPKRSTPEKTIRNILRSDCLFWFIAVFARQRYVRDASRSGLRMTAGAIKVVPRFFALCEGPFFLLFCILRRLSSFIVSQKGK